MNSFYKESDPNPHLHIHVRPRYDKPVMLNGNTYTDSESGHHYALNKSGVLPAEDKEAVFIRLKEWLNRYENIGIKCGGSGLWNTAAQDGGGGL